jgi:hypothetical protein
MVRNRLRCAGLWATSQGDSAKASRIPIPEQNRLKRFKEFFGKVRENLGFSET